MTGFNPISNTANITAQGRGPAFQPVQSRAVSYPARPTLNPQPGAGGGMGGSLGAPSTPGSAPEGAGAFGLPPGGPGTPGGVPGGMTPPGLQGNGMEPPGMGPASTESLLDRDQGALTPGAGVASDQGPAEGAFSLGGNTQVSPIRGASGFGNGVPGRSLGAFGGGASGFGRR